jgi:hypothetical protein
MADPTGEADKDTLRLDFDRRLLLQFRGSAITSDAGLLPYRELDDALSLTDAGAETLADARTGKNGRHRLAGLLRQSVFGRLAGYEDVNDAERLSLDPAMRWVVGGQAITGCAASASQMGRFETKWLSRPENLAALADLAGQWIDKVHQRRPPKTIVLDMDSSESPTYGEQEGSAYNGSQKGEVPPKVERIGLQPLFRLSGTKCSNPSSSTGESANFWFLSGGAPSAACPNRSGRLPRRAQTSNRCGLRAGRAAARPGRPSPTVYFASAFFR